MSEVNEIIFVTGKVNEIILLVPNPIELFRKYAKNKVFT